MAESGILISTVEAAATLLVGTDAFRNSPQKTSARPRVIDGIAIVGGNAIGEATVELMSARHSFGIFENKLNGAVAILLPDHKDPIAPTLVVGADAIVCRIVTAPTVSPLKINVYGREL